MRRRAACGPSGEEELEEERARTYVHVGDRVSSDVNDNGPQTGRPGGEGVMAESVHEYEFSHSFLGGRGRVRRKVCNTRDPSGFKQTHGL